MNILSICIHGTKGTTLNMFFFFFFLINKCVVFNFDQKEELTFGLSCQEVISEPLEGHA